LEVGQKVLKSNGVVIDLTRDAKGALFVCLNTDSDAPLKPGRPSAEAKVAREPSGKGGNATKGNSKGKTAATRKMSETANQLHRKAAVSAKAVKGAKIKAD